MNLVCAYFGIFDVYLCFLIFSLQEDNEFFPCGGEVL